jgi:S-methylmethionine-dependent homocysteine/selenocysteine methylase
MTFTQLLAREPVILTECAISERLRRLPGIELHPVLFNTPLIYNPEGRRALEDIYKSYIEVARDAGLPILLCAPTWRVDQERIEAAGVGRSINLDAVVFMQEIKERYSSDAAPITAGALLAPKNDCYTPGLALERSQSARFHGWQVDELVKAGAEVIVCQTLPAIGEALGMADCLGEARIPYLVSFVINRFGRVLDNTPVEEAVAIIDREAETPPTGYMVNCVYPTFLGAENQKPDLFKRLIGIQANASSKGHEQLDGSDELQQDPLPDWGKNMLELHQEYGVKILGGCCGTDHTYLRYLTEAL